MRKFLLVCAIIVQTHTVMPHAVTYQKVHGRFGNCVWAFSQALWLSYKNDIPLIYTPFKHGEKLTLSHLHQHRDDEAVKQLRERGVRKREASTHLLTLSENQGNLFVLPWRKRVDIDWTDKKFMKLLRKELSPITPHKFLTLPEGRLPVAVHIRVGSAKDYVTDTWHVRRYTERRFPNKFPPKSFYIEQLKRLSELLDDQPMYVYVFTDSIHPNLIIKKLEMEVNKPNILYGCKESSNSETSGILGDFFDMTRFEYFVRSRSTFSFMAEKLANWKISIYPKGCIWEDEMVKVVGVVTDIK